MITCQVDGVDGKSKLIPCIIKSSYVCVNICDLSKLYHSPEPQFLHLREGNDNSNYLRESLRGTSAVIWMLIHDTLGNWC